MPVKEGCVRLGTLRDTPDKRDERLPKPTEERIEEGRVHALLVFIEQGIVGVAFGVRKEREPSGAFENSLQIRAEKAEIIPFLCLAPRRRGDAQQPVVFRQRIRGDALEARDLAVGELRFAPGLFIELIRVLQQRLQRMDKPPVRHELSLLRLKRGKRIRPSPGGIGGGGGHTVAVHDCGGMPIRLPYGKRAGELFFRFEYFHDKARPPEDAGGLFRSYKS